MRCDTNEKLRVGAAITSERSFGDMKIAVFRVASMRERSTKMQFLRKEKKSEIIFVIMEYGRNEGDSIPWK